MLTEKFAELFGKVISDTTVSHYIAVAIVFVLKTVIAIILLKIAISIIKRIIFRILTKRKESARLTTLKTLINNMGNYAFWIALILLMIGFLGLTGVVGAILTGLGLSALIIGLAAQDVFKDLIAGISILGENKFLIGEKVEIGAFMGVVENIKLRTTTLKTDKGEIIFIPNSRIFEVKNHSRISDKSKEEKA